MKASRLIAALMTIASGATLAQSASEEFVQRNINQQQRIEQGLQSGQLNTREAARLEKGEARVEGMEARALRDGQVSRNEARHIDQAQDRLSRDIYREKHDAQVGNPNSPSSQRMQADVQRNVNQQQRIQQGLNSGALTQREAGRLERGQSHTNRMEARAGRDGHVGRFEQQRLQRAEHHQSARINHEKHDRQMGAGPQARADGRPNHDLQGNNGNHFGQNQQGNRGQHLGQQGGRMHVARR